MQDDADADADAYVDVDTDADNDAVTPSTNTWRYTRQSVTSSLGQSFLAGLAALYLTLVVSEWVTQSLTATLEFWHKSPSNLVCKFFQKECVDDGRGIG